MITFRPATEQDADFVMAANKAIEGGIEKLSRARFVQDIIKSGYGRVDIITSPDHADPIGMIFYGFCYWASVGRILWVTQIYVTPVWRGKLIYKIKRHLQETAREEACPLIVWGSANHKQTPNKLWQRLGAEPLNKDFSFWTYGVEG